MNGTLGGSRHNNAVVAIKATLPMAGDSQAIALSNNLIN